MKNKGWLRIQKLILKFEIILYEIDYCVQHKTYMAASKDCELIVYFVLSNDCNIFFLFKRNIFFVLDEYKSFFFSCEEIIYFLDNYNKIF